MIVTDLSNSYYPVPKNKIQRESKEKTKKIQREFKEIKKKSNKLAKLEKERFSILTKDLTKCYMCKSKKQDLHEVFGGKNRQVSMKYGLVIPVCRECHEMIPKDKTLTEKLHKVGQKAFKKHYKTENFLQIFGENYL